MSSIGAIAPNFHEGTRSEYLAQYVFSAFGTSIPVPHPEDSGIDLHCTLGHRTGQRFHVSHYYSVQVKSVVSPIAFETPEAVRWLFGHKYPLFICYIEKRRHRVSIYHTVPATMSYAKQGVSSVTLLPDRESVGFRVIDSAEHLELRLGPPILEFDMTEMEDASWTLRAAEILKAWVEIDQANIDQKAFGVTLFRVPKEYSTNELPSSPWQTLGNFKEFEADPGRRTLAIESLFKILGHLVSVAAAARDRGRVQVIAEFSGRWLESEKPKITKPIEIFVLMLNSALRHVGIGGGICLTEHQPSGPVTGYPILKSED